MQRASAVLFLMLVGLLVSSSCSLGDEGGTLELKFREATDDGEKKLEGVFVWLRPLDPALQRQIREEPAPKLEPALIKFTNSGVEPKSLILFANQPVIVKNESDDGVQPFHDAGDHQGKFVISLGPGKQFKFSFPEASRKPFRIGCFKNPRESRMGGAIVVDNRYVGVSDKEGSASIANIPPGRWRFRFFHPIILSPYPLQDPIKHNGRPWEYVDGMEVEIENQEVADVGTFTLWKCR